MGILQRRGITNESKNIGSFAVAAEPNHTSVQDFELKRRSQRKSIAFICSSLCFILISVYCIQSTPLDITGNIPRAEIALSRDSSGRKNDHPAVTKKTENGAAFQSRVATDQQTRGEENLLPSSSQNVRSNITGSYTVVGQGKCSLTAVFVDPSIADVASNSKHFFWQKGLESFVQYVVGENIDSTRVCLTFQTSTCSLKKRLGENLNENELTSALGNMIYSQMGPLSKQFAKTGRVRLQFLDDVKYRKTPCSDWERSPTKLISSALYYQDEFDVDNDSNHILFIWGTDNALWCRPFDLTKWDHFAYVGAPWTGGAHYLAAEWEKMASFGSKYEKNWGVTDGKGYGVFESLGDPTNISIVGSDRLTLINKEWMLRAINSCPQVQLSMLPGDVVSQKHCKSKGRPEAEIYFGCVLRGIGAPMPSTFEASLFAAKFYWADKIVKEEKGPTDAHKDAVQRYLGEHVVERLNYIKPEGEGTSHVVPIAIQAKNMKIKQCPSI